jgi:tRNA 2-thiouridine synthesizing protein A
MGLFGRKKQEPKQQATGSVTLEDGTSYTVGSVVDCLGDSCPRPQLMTRKAMAAAESGTVVEVKVDNPTSVAALPPMMGMLNGTHLGTVKEDRCWRVILQKN